MKKYLISIENAESPRLSQFFAQSTFQHEIKNFKIFGVVGKQLSASEYFNQAVVGKPKALTPGELGCSLSHLAALKDFIASNESYAIIFEDDVLERFTVDLALLNQEIQSLQLAPCFLLSLGGIQLKICDRVRGKYLDSMLMQQPVLQIDQDFLEYLSSAYAYVVDRAMAELLLQYHQSLRVYDHWHALVEQKIPFTFYATYLFDHPVVTQAKHLSYLEQERQDNNIELCTQSSYRYYWRKKLKRIFLKKYSL